MRKKFKILTISIVFIILIATMASSSTATSKFYSLSKYIKNNQKKIESIVLNEDNYASLKSIAEELGQQLTWDTETKRFFIDDIEKEEIIEVQKVFYAGNYTVGEDIPPGEYKLFSDSIMAYYELSNDGTGNINSIISNDIFNNYTYLTIQEGTFLKLQGSYAIEILNIEEPKYKEIYKDGMYKVGYDIPAGEYCIYKDENQKFGHIEIFSDSIGNFESIISSYIFEDNKTVNLEEGQYIKIQHSYFKENK